MVTVRMVQVSVYKVVGVLPMWHCLVTAVGTVLMAGLMAFTGMVRRVAVGVLC